MDAAAHAELDALRRRAFGPDADIHDDPAALARLIELEDLARLRVAAGATDAAPPPPALESPSAGLPIAEPVDAHPVGEKPFATAPPEPDPLSRRRWTQRATIVTGAVAAAVIVAAVALAPPTTVPLPAAAPSPSGDRPHYAFTANPHSETLLRIRRDGAFGGYIELPSETPPPAFPTTATLDWAAHLGEYYGWDLWIAGGSGDADDEHCVLIRRGDDTRARCADAEGQLQGELFVSLAKDDIPPSVPPDPMAEDDRVRFWWLQTGSVDLVLGSFRED